MIVTIHQPEHLPWIGFFHKMSQADIYVFLDNVQYRKNYFQNRNRILTNRGPEWLTVPVRQNGHMSSVFRSMEMAGPASWQAKYWRTLSYAYIKHPYFADYGPFFEQLMERNWSHLVDLNYAIIQFMADQFGIQPQFLRASELGVGGSSTELLVDICRKVGATTYLSGPSGREYLDLSLFEEHGVQVVFHEFEHPVYPQKGQGEFVSHLSALDLLFNTGPEAARYVKGGTMDEAGSDGKDNIQIGRPEP